MTTWMLLAALGLGCSGGDEEPPMQAPAEDPDNPLPTLELGPAKSRPNPTPGQPGPRTIQKEMCDQLDHGEPVKGPSCFTADISCGDSIVGHTLGGTENFDTKFYEKKFCTPATTDHDGGDERVYRLQMPDGDWTAEVELETPCADLDLAGIQYDGAEDCPTITDDIPRCEMWPKRRGKPERVRLVSQRATTWLIVVEGKKEEEGTFALHVTCSNHL